jgi:tetratricopeptide (TPR) repeat protein
MMKRIAALTFLLILISGKDLSSQAILENKLNFYEAESYLLFEDYTEAVEIYLDLLRIYPTNANLKYRIGQCYVNIPGQKNRAIGYLEDASQRINPKYKEGKFKETAAPYDVFYYLANAYRVTGELDKALETYNTFLQNIDTKVYDTAVVRQQIQSVYNAKDLMESPLYIREINLGDNINEAFSEYNPVISGDGNVLVFTKSLTFYNALMYTSRVNGQWTPPLNLNEALMIDVGRDIFPTSISPDGKTLYLYGPENFDGVIFTSTFTNGAWSLPARLNDNINTKYWESHATISNDNKKLFFTSNRKGTLGGLDIYVSHRDSTGNWGPAINLGPVINTPYNEETPFLSKDDKNLFFSSRGHFNIGGYDIFYSTMLDNGEWSKPLNVGYPLNSTDDDVFFNPVNEGYEGYYAKFNTRNGESDQDIYMVELYSENHPRKFIIRGVARVADLMSNAVDKVRISAMKISNPDQVVIVYSDPITGEYELQLPHGEYILAYEAPGGEKVMRNLDLPISGPADTLQLSGTLLPKTDFVADLFIDSNQSISVAAGDTLKIPVKTEPGSLLTVEHWMGDSLLFTENFNVTDTAFLYTTVTHQGTNKLVFKSTDKFNNTTTAELFLVPEPVEPVTTIARPEYSRIVASRQIAALTEMQKERAGDELRKVIARANVEKQQFGRVDDQVAYIKERALTENIDPDEVDLLMLKVALMDNVLTQAAVDLLAANATGDLKKLLEEIDIYELNLKTWNDLEKYLASKSGGTIGAEALNQLAENILSGVDTSIPLIKDRILAYTENSENGELINQSITLTEQKNIRKAGQWLQSVTAESIKKGLTEEQMAEMIAYISTLSDTELQDFINMLIRNSDDPLQTWINSLDLKKARISTPEELIAFLLRSTDEVPEESIYNGLTKNIVASEIPVENIRERTIASQKKGLWYLWVLGGATALIFILFLARKQSKKKS